METLTRMTDHVMSDANLNGTFTTNAAEPKSVCNLITKWARKQPNHPAVLYESGRKVTYRELDDASSRIAWLLRCRLVQSGDLVPVLATRSIEMVASFLGVLKAGACYVPIDIEAWSDERVQSTLERVRARVVINLGSTNNPNYDVVSCNEVEATFKPTMAQELEQQELLSPPQSCIKPMDLAYVIFTSGTTSTPKGVMIPHRALLNYVQQGNEETPFNGNARPDDITLLIFSPGFDACTGLVFSMLCNGAQVMIPSTSNFLSCIPRVTILTATPSVLAAVEDPQMGSQLRTIILGGEAPPPWLVKKWWAPGRNIYNGYGPTETTISSLMGRIYPEKPITLGRSMPNSRVILLDGDSESDHGEICITGPGLAIGYYQDEVMTARKFVYWQGERMYRTGDFARRTEHGLVFSGRADSFVKNRGFLVNLEAQVIPMLLEAGALAATAFMHRDLLVAFVTPSSLETTILRQTLSHQHDAFLVPDQIRAMDALPLTANGKPDNRALQREFDLVAFENYDAKLSNHENSKIETLKAAISAATLLPLSEVVNSRSFFELGGNSLAAMKVLSYLQKKNLTLSLKELFSLPDLVAVSDAIQDGDATNIVGSAMVKNKGDSEEDDESKISSGPMTSLQTRLVRSSMRSPGTNYMLLRMSLSHPGNNLDQVNLRNSWQRTLERHTIFRTVFLLKDELQVVQPKLVLDWTGEETTVDQLDVVVHARSLELNKRMMIVDEKSETFIPVSAFRFITVPGKGSTLLISSHHAQSDGWSLSIVLDEVRAALNGELLSVNTPQFMSVARVQKQRQTNPEGVSFWTDILQDCYALPRLSIPRPPSDTKRSEWTSSLNVALGFTGSELEDGARFLHVTPSCLVYTAWGLVLSNYMCSDRIAFGATFSGRNLMAVPDVEHIVGPLINTVPFPITFDQEHKSTVADTVSAINSRLLQMLEFQWSAAEAMSSMDADSILGAMQSIVVTEYDLPPLSGSWTVERHDMMEFGISLLLEKADGDDERLQARILFDNSSYVQSRIRGLLTHFKNALRALMDHNNKFIQDVRERLMDEEEKLPLIQPSNFDSDPYTGPNTIKDAFETVAAKWPLMYALESAPNFRMTYQELEEASNKIARWLRILCIEGVKPKDVVVGVLSDGSPNWIVGVLAVIKAGCVCSTIDISLPIARINAIIEQSGGSIFLAANRRCAEALPQRYKTSTVVIIEDFLQDFSNISAAPVETLTRTADTIYIVFTSGSTGIPKGVPLHNLSVLHVIDSPEMRRFFGGPGRRIAQLCGLGFDVALLEVLGSLCSGATLVMKDPTNPFEHLKHVSATMATPSLWSAYLPEDYGNLDTIALVGEPVPQALCDTWASKVRLLNGYGPSECGPLSTIACLLPGEKVTVGRPLPRVSVYVLDHRQCLLPPGITGEVYISGKQVTGKYLNAAAEQTKTPFVPDHISSQKNNRVMYRTGDLAYWNEDMTLSYVGRVDRQVKVRGFRIELEEIEKALVDGGKNKVQTAAAITVNNSDHGLQIVGFVAPSDVDIDALRASLVALLPAYARPTRIIAISEMPKSANLKLDRKALLKLATESGRGETDLDGEEDFPQLLNPTEKLIATVWKELLGLGGKTQIHRHDDFLTIGGNSILAIKAARLIASSIGHDVPVVLLIRETILKSLARAIDRHTALSSASRDSFSSYLSTIQQTAVSNDLSKPYPLSYLEDDMLYAYIVSDTKSAYHTTVQFTIHGDYNPSALVEAFTAIVQENPILRARYVVSGGQPFRAISPKAFAPQCFVGDILSARKLQDLVDEPFNLETDQFFRVIMWIRGGEYMETEVTIVTHHLITDKASLGLMLQWIGRKYRDVTGAGGASADNHERFLASEKKCHYAEGTYIDWAQWLQIQEQNSSKSHLQLQEKNIDFWHHHLQGMQPIPQLHQSRLGQERGLTQFLHIPTTLVDSGQKYSQRMAVAATALTLGALFGTSDLVIALPYINRDDHSTANMLGLFVDQLPIRILLNDVTSVTALLDAVTNEINLAIAHRLPYVKIKSAMSTTDEPVNIVDVMVVYHWQTDSFEKSFLLGPNTKLRWRSDGTKASGSLFSLLLQFREQDDGSVDVEIEYKPALISPQTMSALTACLLSTMQGLAQQVLP